MSNSEALKVASAFIRAYLKDLDQSTMDADTQILFDYYSVIAGKLSVMAEKMDPNYEPKQGD